MKIVGELLHQRGSHVDDGLQLLACMIQDVAKVVEASSKEDTLQRATDGELVYRGCEQGTTKVLWLTKGGEG